MILVDEFREYRDFRNRRIEYGENFAREIF